MQSLLVLLGFRCIIGPINSYGQEGVAVLPDFIDRSVVAFVIVNLANCAKISMTTADLDSVIVTY